MTLVGPWAVLGIPPTRERAAIRRAYAARLKVVHPEDDAAGFQALRRAYEQALAYAGRGGVAGQAVFFQDREPISPPPPPPPVEPEPELELEPEPRLQLDPVRDPDSPEPASPPSPPPPPPPPPAPAPAPPPPPPPASRVGAEVSLHDAACNRLARLVTRAEPPEPAQLKHLVEEILAGPAMDQIAVHLRTEAWLAGLIAGRLARTDPLVGPAVARFGWVIDERDRNANPAVAAVVRRLDDLRYLSQLALKTHPLNAAWRLLRRAPDRGDAIAALLIPGRMTDMRSLIDAIRRDHPGVAVNVPTGVMDAWAAFLDRPRPPALAIWACLGVGLLVGLAGAGSLLGGRTAAALTSGRAYAAWAVGLPAAGLALLAAKQFAVDEPAWRWRRQWVHAAPSWLSLGWAPALGLVLVLGAALPPSLPSEIAVGALATATAVWAAITGQRASSSPGQWPWPIRFVGRNLAPGLMWGLILSRTQQAGVVQGALAASAGALVWRFGEQSLVERWWRPLKPLMRQLIIGALFIAAIGLVFALAPLGARPPSAPLAVALTALALAQRLPATTAKPFAPKINLTGRNVFGLLWMALVGGSILAGVLAAVAVAATILSAWIIALGSAAGLVRAAQRERAATPKTPARPKAF